MRKSIYYVIALAAGMALSIEGAIYSELGKVIGKFESSFYNFFAGSIILLIIVLFFGKGQMNQALKVPKWYLLGGLFCVIYLSVLVYAIPKVGVGIAMISAVIGQISASMMLEHYKWLGSPRKRMTKNRTIACLSMLLALYFIY
ncbi:EamA-like transporter family protein [Bacillus mangrovi]|uniref:EamA-like transporter family protein n=1 Tax=Metabacillus mangrovi TaxID=1491830 RepID=A0A7X2V5Y3_9BACI|nr:DMT family transporter [Metabacillus mangrovi]MTH55287.1 EamA-like transporter family protein [Metabacillus mangrovi]